MTFQWQITIIERSIHAHSYILAYTTIHYIVLMVLSVGHIKYDYILPQTFMVCSDRSAHVHTHGGGLISVRVAYRVVGMSNVPANSIIKHEFFIEIHKMHTYTYLVLTSA